MEKNKTKTRNLFITKILWQSSEILPLLCQHLKLNKYNLKNNY